MNNKTMPKKSFSQYFDIEITLISFFCVVFGAAVAYSIKIYRNFNPYDIEYFQEYLYSFINSVWERSDYYFKIWPGSYIEI